MKCGKMATIHLTEIIGNQKVEKHLCAECAETEGVSINAGMPISKLLEDFVLQAPSSSEKEIKEALPEITCDSCGITFKEFQKNGMLGCPNDYRVFSSALRSLIARSQDGKIMHVGKIPHNADNNQQKEAKILVLRNELRDAIRAENYEAAANLRDNIKKIDCNDS